MLEIQTLAPQPRTASALADFCILDHRTESELCFWLETWTAEMRTRLLANVLEQEVAAVFQDKNVCIKKTHHHAEVYPSRVNTRLARLSSRLS